MSATAGAWLLCVILDRNSASPTRFCLRVPSEAACKAAMIDWLHSGWAWEDRWQHHGRNSIAAGCSPIDESKPL